MKANFGAATGYSIVRAINTIISILLVKWIEEEKIGKNLISIDEINDIERDKKNCNRISHNVTCNRLLMSVLATILYLGALLPALQLEPMQHAYAQTYRNIINLSNVVPFAADPRIAISGNNVYVVWTEAITGGSPSAGGRNSDIFFSKSTDNGASFTNPVGLTNYKPGIKQEPKIAISGKNLYIIWSDYSLGAAEIFFTKSTDNGTSFSSPLALGTSFGAVGETRLAASANNVYVMWIGSANNVDAGAVLFKTSTDNGSTFGNTTSLSNKGIASKPEMSLAGNSVYVVWYNTTLQASGNVVDDEILFAKSTNSGARFSSPINISNNPNSFSARPQVAALGRNVYVAWFESGPSHSLNIANTYFARSIDAGVTFSTPIKLSNNGPANNYNLTSASPKIAFSNFSNNNNVYVLWTYVSSFPSSTPQNTDVFFSRSIDAGVTFSSPFNISNNPGLSGDASMIVSTNPKNIHTDEVNVMWLDDTGGKSGERNVYFSQSTDNGASFGNPINLSNTQGSSLLSQMVISGNNLYLTWAEFSSGSYSILFRVVSLS
ncbi:MAG: glycoside hydrolase [Thermoproteota archaeon]|nr:glycoside hydrolase [Thermoproteota archaeon]